MFKQIQTIPNEIIHAFGWCMGIAIIGSVIGVITLTGTQADETFDSLVKDAEQYRLEELRENQQVKLEVTKSEADVESSILDFEYELELAIVSQRIQCGADTSKTTPVC